jgi:hypothetical protein
MPSVRSDPHRSIGFLSEAKHNEHQLDPILKEEISVAETAAAAYYRNRRIIDYLRGGICLVFVVL